MSIRNVVLTAALLAPTGAWAQSITIGASGPYASLQAAVDAAGVLGTGTTISITAGTVSSTDVVSFTNKSITIEGAGSTQTTLSATGGTAVIRLDAGATLTVKNLKLAGTGTGQRAITSLEVGNSLHLADVVVDSAYTSAPGGGIDFGSGDALTMTDVTFLGRGGASLATSGGSIYVSSPTQPVTLTRVTFINSVASTNGGAIYATGADLTCDGCVFDSPSAASKGGGIYADGGTLTVRRSRFSGAAATSGAGVYGTVGTGSLVAVLTNNIFGQGTADNGSAINANKGTFTVTNNDFIGNSGGAAAENAATSGTLTMKNNLFLDNEIGATFAFAGSSISNSWFQNNGTTVVGYTLPGSNHVETLLPNQVLLVGDKTDALDPALYPTPLTSPLLEAGDGNAAYKDLDGTNNDVGAFGGPETDPTSAVAFDTDGDGAWFLHDCDDNNGENFPTNTETCASVGDNDCDGLADDADGSVTDKTTWHADCDADGHGDEFSSITQCFRPTGCTYLSAADLSGGDPGDDCDDTSATVNPDADEYCNGVDDDCNTYVDDNAVDAVSYYTDNDNDGYGDSHTEILSCSVSPGPNESAVGGDCDDTKPDYHPGAPDPCDGFDQDCGGADGDATNSDPYYPDTDGDGYGDGANPVYSCEPLTVGYSADTTDCDDTNPDVNPGAIEVCDGLDDNCNTQIDDVGLAVMWYQDLDLDGYGDDVFTVQDDCQPGVTWSQVGGDCDDQDATISPEAVEACNGFDDNCDGLTDDEDPDVAGAQQLWLDADQDGYGSCDPMDPTCSTKAVCTAYTSEYWADNPDDCDDANPAVNPSRPEIAGNSIDENCDGTVADPPDDERVAGGGGCNCSTSAAPVSFGPWLLGSLLALTIRRRR